MNRFPTVLILLAAAALAGWRRVADNGLMTDRVNMAELEELALELAQTASGIARAHFRRPLPIENKRAVGFDPVTAITRQTHFGRTIIQEVRLVDGVSPAWSASGTAQLVGLSGDVTCVGIGAGTVTASLTCIVGWLARHPDEQRRLAEAPTTWASDRSSPPEARRMRGRWWGSRGCGRCAEWRVRCRSSTRS